MSYTDNDYINLEYYGGFGNMPSIVISESDKSQVDNIYINSSFSGKVLETQVIENVDLSRTATNCAVTVTVNGTAISDGEKVLQVGSTATISVVANEGYTMEGGTFTITGATLISENNYTINSDVTIVASAVPVQSHIFNGDLTFENGIAPNHYLAYLPETITLDTSKSYNIKIDTTTEITLTYDSAAIYWKNEDASVAIGISGSTHFIVLSKSVYTVGTHHIILDKVETPAPSYFVDETIQMTFNDGGDGDLTNAPIYANSNPLKYSELTLSDANSAQILHFTNGIVSGDSGGWSVYTYDDDTGECLLVYFDDEYSYVMAYKQNAVSGNYNIKVNNTNVNNPNVFCLKLFQDKTDIIENISFYVYSKYLTDNGIEDGNATIEFFMGDSITPEITMPVEVETVSTCPVFVINETTSFTTTKSLADIKAGNSFTLKITSGANVLTIDLGEYEETSGAEIMFGSDALMGSIG